MPDDLPHIFDLTPEALGDLVQRLGMPAFRGKQIMQWVYARGVVDPQQMTNLSKADRQTLMQRIRWCDGQVVGASRASDGTEKLLMQWGESEQAEPNEAGRDREDEAPGRTAADVALSVLDPSQAMVLDPARQTECVMIPAGELERDDGQRQSARRTACISSQVGCPVGCRFCASGLGGLDANLTAGQIVEQVWHLNHRIAPARISHVVFMGMGEPLANFNAVSGAIDTLTAPWGFDLAARRITLSTVGLPAQIRRLAQKQRQITLAISLHAPNDELRRELIPWAQRVTIAQLIEAGRYYFEKTGREVTLEYILLRQVNDQIEHARQLAKVARSLRANVNLIRYNEVASLGYDRPRTGDVLAFEQVLRDARVNVHIRASRGRDIAAACGQLRHEGARAGRQ